MDEMRISEPVPYIVYEAERARAERLLTDERERHDANLRDEREARRKNRLLDFIIIIVLVILFVGSNIAWIVYESQFEETQTITQEVEQTTEDGGDNSFIGGDVYGSAESEDDGH